MADGGLTSNAASGAHRQRASIMSAAGLPLERVAGVLGHDGARMTALVHRHAGSPTVAGALLMEDALG